MCKRAWNKNDIGERYNYLKINRMKDKNDEKYVIRNASTSKGAVCTPETDPFLTRGDFVGDCVGHANIGSGADLF